MEAEDIGRIVADYGAVLAEPSGLGVVRDLSSLPHPKSDIKAALKIALGTTKDATMHEHLKVAYVSLADFQELTEIELRALHLWNSALSSPTMTDRNLHIISTEADAVIAVQNRIVDEGASLKAELEAAGFWSS